MTAMETDVSAPDAPTAPEMITREDHDRAIAEINDQVRRYAESVDRYATVIRERNETLYALQSDLAGEREAHHVTSQAHADISAAFTALFNGETEADTLARAWRVWARFGDLRDRAERSFPHQGITEIFDRILRDHGAMPAPVGITVGQVTEGDSEMIGNIVQAMNDHADSQEWCDTYDTYMQDRGLARYGSRATPTHEYRVEITRDVSYEQHAYVYVDATDESDAVRQAERMTEDGVRFEWQTDRDTEDASDPDSYEAEQND